jgi:hypothetical protein
MHPSTMCRLMRPASSRKASCFLSGSRKRLDESASRLTVQSGALQTVHGSCGSGEQRTGRARRRWGPELEL